MWPTNRTGENRTGEPRPLDWTPSEWDVSWELSWDVSEVGAFVRVLEGPKTGKSTLMGPVVGALVGDLVGALVGPLVGPLLVPLVNPLVGRGSLSPALCVAHDGFWVAILAKCRQAAVWTSLDCRMAQRCPHINFIPAQAPENGDPQSPETGVGQKIMEYSGFLYRKPWSGEFREIHFWGSHFGDLGRFSVGYENGQS